VLYHPKSLSSIILQSLKRQTTLFSSKRIHPNHSKPNRYTPDRYKPEKLEPRLLLSGDPLTETPNSLAPDIFESDYVLQADETPGFFDQNQHANDSDPKIDKESQEKISKNTHFFDLSTVTFDHIDNSVSFDTADDSLIINNENVFLPQNTIQNLLDNYTKSGVLDVSHFSDDFTFLFKKSGEILFYELNRRQSRQEHVPRQSLGTSIKECTISAIARTA